MTVVAIHQPNFLPWLGYFHKMASASVFVLLDDVQLARRSWTTRVDIARGPSRRRLTAPVHHTGSQSLSIAEALVDTHARAWQKQWRGLSETYRNSPGWADLGPKLEPWLREPPESLLELNLGLLDLLREALGITTPTLRSSELSGRGGKSELMASLARAAGGSVYLSGGWDPDLPGRPTAGASGADYNDRSVFEDHGVELRYQNFSAPTYSTAWGDALPGLSAIDALFHLGRHRAQALIGIDATVKSPPLR